MSWFDLVDRYNTIDQKTVTEIIAEMSKIH